MIIETAAATISSILQGVQVWRDREACSDREKKNRNKAIGKVMKAATATKAYLYDARELGNTSRGREHELSQAWQEAATAISAYDENLFHSSQVKSLGWADPREWEKLMDKAVTVNPDQIIEQCEWLRANT